jgi:hypothetical protein
MQWSFRSLRLWGTGLVLGAGLALAPAALAQVGGNKNWCPPDTIFPQSVTSGAANPQQPQQPRPPQDQVPEQDMSAERSGAGGGEQASLSTPHMIGDFPGQFAFANTVRTVTIQGVNPALPGPLGQAPLFNVNANVAARARVPLASNGAFKIAENESPMPLDRVFVNFNYFYNINQFTHAIGAPTIVTGTPTVGVVNSFSGFGALVPTPALQTIALTNPTVAAVINTAGAIHTAAVATGNQALYDQYLRAVITENNALPANASPALQAAINNVLAANGKPPAYVGGVRVGPGLAFPAAQFNITGITGGLNGVNFDVTNGRLGEYREILGFEKTFLDGDASFGIRMPLVQLQGDGSVAMSDVADLTFITKYAFINNRQTGTVLSGGLAVTTPNGPDITFAGNQTFHSVLLQPYMGGIYRLDRLFLQGFSSIVVPTGAQESVLWFNSYGAGLTVFQSSESILTSVTPVLEGHLTTPFNNHDPNGLIYSPYVFDLTGGVHFGVGRRSYLTVGACMPLTGPKPFDTEIFGQVNFRF